MSGGVLERMQRELAELKLLVAALKDEIETLKLRIK